MENKENKDIVSITLDNPSESEVQAPPKRPLKFKILRFCAFVSIVLLNTLVNFQKTCPSVVADQMSIAYGVDKAEVKTFSSSYFWTYAAMQPFSGLLSDLFDPSIVLAILALVSSAGSSICGFSNNMGVGSFGRILVGLGTGPTYVAALKIFSNWYPKDQLPTVLGLNMALSSIGGFLSGTPLQAFCNTFGWRWAFHTIGIVGGVLSTFVLIFIRGSPERQGFDPVNVTNKAKKEETFCESLSNLFRNIWQVLIYGYFWVIVLFNVGTVSVFLNIAGFSGGIYLTDVLHFTPNQRASAMLSFHTGVLIGSIILPQIAKWVKSKKIVLIGSAILIAAPLFTLFFLGNKATYITIWIYWTIIGTFSRPVLSLSYPIATSYYCPVVSGSTVGIANFFLNLMAGVFQMISGAIIPLYDTKVGDKPVHTWKGYQMGVWLFNGVCAAISILMGIIMKDNDSKMCTKTKKVERGELNSTLLLAEVQKTDEKTK